MHPLSFAMMVDVCGTCRVDDATHPAVNETTAFGLWTVTVVTGHGPMDVLVSYGGEMLQIEIGALDERMMVGYMRSIGNMTV